jgi:hypothetical protein
MNATPARSHLSDADGNRWVSIAAIGALACALSPILPLLSIVPWPVVINGALPVAIVLTAVALWTTRVGPTRLRRTAVAALVTLVIWLLMYIGWGLALLYG